MQYISKIAISTWFNLGSNSGMRKSISSKIQEIWKKYLLKNLYLAFGGNNLKMDDKKMQETDLFLELASEIRYSILKLLKEEHLKQSQVAKKLDINLPESHRQLERLEENGFVRKESNGNFALTSFGQIILQQTESLSYISKFRTFFQDHTLGNLPKKFVTRISDLSNSSLVEGAFVLNEKMKKIAKEGEYLRVVSAHVPPDAFYKGLEKARSGKEISVIYGENTIIPKGFKEELRNPEVQQLMEKGIYRRKMIPKVQVFVVLNDIESLVIFPNLKGEVDLSFGFFSNDEKFHDWCLDYHNYLWENADFCELSKMRES